ncbi:7470_t:CDS:1, partial [Gigaspora rosea]
ELKKEEMISPTGHNKEKSILIQEKRRIELKIGIYNINSLKQ